jgi:molybdopterin-guanine dinucleotide biosynthesis protein A
LQDKQDKIFIRVIRFIRGLFLLNFSVLSALQSFSRASVFMILAKSKFSGCVLAGGKSSRMGIDKAFLKLDGATFLERAVNALESVCENRVKIVLNQTQAHFIENFPRPISYLFDVYKNRGPLGGIHAALKDSDTDFSLILACDLPLVSFETIKTLAQIVLHAPENFAAFVPRETDGRFQPLCAAYNAKKCLPVIEEMLKTETSASMKDFLRRIPVRFIEQSELTAGETQNLFFNVNCPSDFRQLG